MNVNAAAIMLAAVAGAVLFLAFWRLSGNRTWRAVVCSLATASILMNVRLVVHYVISPQHELGGGQHKLSPDGTSIAKAQSRRPVLNDFPTYYVFAIESEDGRPLKSLRIDTSENKDPMYLREFPEMIRWSEDSRDVTFDIPGLQIRMTRGDGSDLRFVRLPPDRGFALGHESW